MHQAFRIINTSKHTIYRPINIPRRYTCHITCPITIYILSILRQDKSLVGATPPAVLTRCETRDRASLQLVTNLPPMRGFPPQRPRFAVVIWFFMPVPGCWLRIWLLRAVCGCIHPCPQTRWFRGYRVIAQCQPTQYESVGRVSQV